MKKLLILFLQIITITVSAQVSGIWSRVTAGGTNTYTAPAPSGFTATSYTDGSRFHILFTNSNSSSAVTLAIGSAPAKTVYNSKGEALEVAELGGTDEKILTYNSNLNGFKVFGGAGSGGGGGSGTVTSVSVTSVNGISGSVANASSTPAISLSLGAITPLSVNGVPISGSATPSLSITGATSISGSNTGDNAVNATSNTYADGKVVDAINNGTTDIAPSENAVFDALALKVPTTTAVNGHALSGDVTVTKSDVGLGNADNTSDANKPVSTATQTALDLKANLASPTLTGTPLAPTAVGSTNTTQIATTAFVKASSPKLYSVACSDLSTTLSSGTNKGFISLPFAFTVVSVRAYVLSAQSAGSIITVDINEAGTSILSTKLTIDNNETDSATAATAYVLSDTSIAANARITFDIDVATGGTGLIVEIFGY